MWRSILSVFGLVLALGTTGPVLAEESDGESPASAILLTTTQTDDFTGDVGGAFRYYTLDYGTWGRVGKLAISTTPGDPDTSHAVGVNLWKDGSLVATGSALGSTPLGATPGTNSIAFAAPTFGPILVQVFNYAHGSDVSYQLDLTWVGPTAVTTGQAATLASARESETLSGSLAGNRAGSFVNREFWSPGDGSTQSVSLAFAPSGPDVGSAVFLNLYQNGALIGSGKGVDAQSGLLTVDFPALTEGPVLVQVNNQNDGTAITYTLAQSQVVVSDSSGAGEGDSGDAGDEE
jgi:hypothetical protein